MGKNVKLVGCGVKIERKLGVSVFDNNLSFDLGRFAKFWYMYDVFADEVEK